MSENKSNKKDLNDPVHLIGVAVKELGCTGQTIKNYEAAGYLKAPIARDMCGRRRLSRNQISELKSIWKARTEG